MKNFEGFPSRMQFTPVPNLVFSTLLPEITDLCELKVLLYIFKLVYLKKGALRFVTYNELLNQPGTWNPGEISGDLVRKALDALIAKNIILHLSLKKGDNQQEIYFLNNDVNRLALARIKTGEIVLPDIEYEAIVQPGQVENPDIFTLYEQNIGILTPLIVDELKEACKHYPDEWIKDAVKEAVSLNKRNWKYIARILEHWLSEGKDDGTHRRNLKKNEDPDKYIRGKYGHMVQR